VHVASRSLNPIYIMNRFLLPFAFAVAALPVGVSAQNALTTGRTLATPVTSPEAAGGVTITQNLSLDIIGGGVACGATDGTYTAENSYWRVFDLSEEPEINDDFTVTEVGVGAVTGEWFASVPPQTTTVRLYTLSTAPAGGGFSLSNLTEVGSADFVYDGNVIAAEILNIPVTGTFESTDIMVVEWFTPTGDPTVTGLEDYFDIRYGQNSAGQTAPTYLSSESCAITDPVETAQLGAFGDLHWVLTVTGTLGTTSTEDGAEARRVTLGQGYPNPLRTTSTVPFSVNEPSHVRLAVYDVLGREVAVLADRAYGAGDYDVAFDAAGLSSGTYVVRLEANGAVQTQRVMVAE
jgi:hypothetical protein